MPYFNSYKTFLLSSKLDPHSDISNLSIECDQTVGVHYSNIPLYQAIPHLSAQAYDS